MIDKLFEDGLYADFKIDFNGREFNIHLEYLKDISEYFSNAKNNTLKGINKITINHEKLSGVPLKPEIFNDFLKIVYYNKNINESIGNKTITDIIEFSRLCELFVIKDMFNSIKSILRKKIMKNSYDTLDYCIGKCPKKCDRISKFKNTKSLAEEICKVYKPINGLDFTQTNYLLNIFCDDNFGFRRRIIGLCNINIEDLTKFNKMYHEVAASTYLFQRLSVMEKTKY